MNFFQTSSSKWTAFLVLLAIAAGAVVFVAPSADAVPSYGTHIKYYSTAAKTTQVGYRYYDCNGVLQSQWGVTSPYYTSATYGCIAEP